jgi:hypothetical protein
MKINMRLPKATRRGICISPRVHLARLLFFFVATPLLTWYGHQYFTNPYKYHTFIRLDNTLSTATLNIYEESKNGLRDNLFINLEDISSSTKLSNGDNISINDSFKITIISNNNDTTISNSYSSYSSTIYNNDKNLIIKNNLANLAIITNFNQSNYTSLKDLDLILIGDIPIDSILKIRSKISPKLLVYWGEKSHQKLPTNIIYWNFNDRKYVKYKSGRYRLISPNKE